MNHYYNGNGLGIEHELYCGIGHYTTTGISMLVDGNWDRLSEQITTD